MKQFYTVALLLLSFINYGQTIIFSENMGPASPTGTIAIASNVFQNTSLTFSGNADTRTTTVSNGYTGASGGRNVFFGTASSINDRNFVISGINTQNFSNYNLSFGTVSPNATDRLKLEYSTDGTNFTDIPFTAPGNTNWTLITLTNVTLPVSNTLSLRFSKNDALTYRVDDVILTGTPTFPALSVSTTSLTNLKYVFGNGPSKSQFFSVSGVNLNGSNVTVSVPGGSNFEISETENGTYSTSIILNAYDGTSKDIYVKLKAGLTVNTYSDVLTISGGGAATSGTVALSGFVREVIFLIYDFDDSVATPSQEPTNAVTSPFQVSIDALEFSSNPSSWTTTNGTNIPFAQSLTNWTSVNKADAKYYFYTMTANSNFKIDLTNISFEWRSTSNGPSAITVEINGTEIATFDAAGDTNTVFTMPITIANQNSIEVRIKGWLNESRASLGTGILRIDDVRLDGTVSAASLNIDDFALSQISLYPNPVNNGVLNIVSPTKERKEISLFDVTGRMVLKTITEENSINVSQLKTGLYLLNININGSKKTSKIIIN